MQGRAAERGAVEIELARARGRLELAVRREANLRERWLRAMDDGDEAREQQAAEAHRDVLRERDDARAAVDRLEAALAAEPEQPNTDALLDAWNDLARAVRGDGGSLGDLNERLRAKFEEFRLDRMDYGTVGVLPMLHREAVDPAALYRAWKEAGEPEPTTEAIKQYWREEAAENPIWATGQHSIRPPAKALRVSTEKGPHSHL